VVPFLTNVPLARWDNLLANTKTRDSVSLVHYSYAKNSRGFNTPRYIVDLTIGDHLPEWMPMFGKKVRIYYHGMRKQCSNCYDLDHLRKDCTSPKLNWIGYVDKLRKTGKYEDQMFGSWLDAPRGETTADLRNYLDDPENLKKAVANFLEKNNKKSANNQQNRNEPPRNPQNNQGARENKDRNGQSSNRNGQSNNRNSNYNRRDTRDLRSHLDRNRNRDQSQDRYRWRNPNQNQHQERRDSYNGNNSKRGRRN
jgi:hypothetical protein